MKQCPHCSSYEGYYLKTQIRGNSETRFSFDGNYDEEKNSDMHDSLKYKFSKYAYCQSCRKRLFVVN